MSDVKLWCIKYHSDITEEIYNKLIQAIEATGCKPRFNDKNIGYREFTEKKHLRSWASKTTQYAVVNNVYNCTVVGIDHFLKPETVVNQIRSYKLGSKHIYMDKKVTLVSYNKNLDTCMIFFETCPGMGHSGIMTEYWHDQDGNKMTEGQTLVYGKTGYLYVPVSSLKPRTEEVHSTSVKPERVWKYKVGDKFRRDASIVYTIEELPNVGINTYRCKRSSDNIVARNTEAYLDSLVRIETYTVGEAASTEPELSKDKLMAYAKEHYPPGTHFIAAHVPNNKDACIMTEDSVLGWNCGNIIARIDGQAFNTDSKYGSTMVNRNVYYEGRWAEIVSKSETVPVAKWIPKFKVGDSFRCKYDTGVQILTIKEVGQVPREAYRCNEHSGFDSESYLLSAYYLIL